MKSKIAEENTISISAIPFWAAAVITCSVVGPAVAQDQTYSSWNGHQYTLTCNADGIVLKSVFPVVRFAGHGAGMREIVGIETLYLGRNCDAWSEALGTGHWRWSNSGFWAVFEQREIRFVRQEPICPGSIAFDIFVCEDR
ncbi:hypothetical protein [Tropicimonas sp. IMCC6043]|uniref:hypothetical protein n=1 Tax=Tropicimonas sp. IMCC6043 TaxID=2510645 RepID=UPI00101B5B5A|nr:hypothetical protein [Tropicimonas sp. IMCC6043]RYH05872.1 hypothetical protein EU800_25725 [Tropicimonas sp. IMCC6043]